MTSPELLTTFCPICSGSARLLPLNFRKCKFVFRTLILWIPGVIVHFWHLFSAEQRADHFGGLNSFLGKISCHSSLEREAKISPYLKGGFQMEPKTSKSKKAVATITAAALAGLLAGCAGGGADKATTETAPTTTESQEAAPEATSTETKPEATEAAEGEAGKAAEGEAGKAADGGAATTTEGAAKESCKGKDGCG